MDVSSAPPWSADRTRTEVDAAAMQLWKEAVLRVRMAQLIVNGCPDPAPGSPLAADDEACPAGMQLSTATRGVLVAALDNLMLWCDTVMPRVFVEGVVNESSPRPHFTLARAGMECAAQVLWVLTPDESEERLRRHLRLVLADMEEERKATKFLDVGRARAIAQRAAAIREGADEVKAAPNYVDLVRGAASYAGVAADHAEVMWRIASAATHGKLWFVGATHAAVVGEEVEQRRGHVKQAVEPSSVTTVMVIASRLVAAAADLCAQRSGADLVRLGSEALNDLRNNPPRAVRSDGDGPTGNLPPA